MTIAAAQSFNVFFGDGSTTVFSYSFPINSSDGSDIYLYVVDDDGTVTRLTSNYSINVGSAQITYPTVGGVAPLDSGINALPSGWKMVALRIEDLSQLVSLVAEGPFPSATLMAAFDKLTMICQQLQEQVDRCVKYPVGTTPSSTDVDAFIAAVSAVIQAPWPSGTYAYLKSLAVTTPGTPFIGLANDLAEATTNTLVFYCGNPAVGDAGFVQP